MNAGRKLIWVTTGVAMSAAFGAASCQDLPEIPNDPPTAAFVYSPVSPIAAGATVVQFNASGTRDRDGSITRYRWDFGDGTPPLESDNPVANHVFPDTPFFCLTVVYGVLLTVTDDAGDTAVASQNVTVVELPMPESFECRELQAGR